MLIRICEGTPHRPTHVTLRCDVSSFVVYCSTCEVIRVNTLMVISVSRNREAWTTHTATGAELVLFVE